MKRWMALSIAAGMTLAASAALAAGNAEAGKKIFDQRCASCHGTAGKGDGPAGAALNPKPRDFTDKKWQKSVTDEHIKTVIQKGGAAVGLSPLMPPMGNGLSDQDLADLVAYIRSLGK